MTIVIGRENERKSKVTKVLTGTGADGKTPNLGHLLNVKVVFYLGQEMRDKHPNVRKDSN